MTECDDCRLLGEDALLHFDAGVLQARNAAARGARIRITQGNNGAGGLRCDDGISTGHAPAFVGAGLQRDVDGAAFRLAAGSL